MDEVVTHADVIKWLPPDVARSLVLALPPNLRGWYTAAEAEHYDGNLVEVMTFGDREPRFIRGRN